MSCNSFNVIVGHGSQLEGIIQCWPQASLFDDFDVVKLVEVRLIGKMTLEQTKSIRSGCKDSVVPLIHTVTGSQDGIVNKDTEYT